MNAAAEGAPPPALATPPTADRCLDDANPALIRLPPRLSKDSGRAGPRAPASPPACEPIDPSNECRYAWARYHFVTMRPDLAAPELRALALDPASGELGRSAATLALESLNMLATHAEPPRPACIANIEEDTKRYLEVHCATTPEPDEELCLTLWRIERDIARLEIESLVKLADEGPPNDSRTLYMQAGNGYRRLFDEHCDLKLPRHRRADARCEELLYNAFRAFRAGGRPVEAQAARAALLDPRNGLYETQLAKKVASEPAP